MSHDFPDGPDYNPEPLDDDPWDVPEAHPDPPEDAPDATETILSPSDAPTQE